MVLLLLIVLALVFGVLGAVVKGLLWLVFIGVALLVAAAVLGVAKRRQRS